MRLQDVRRLAIAETARFRFTISGNQECLIDEHGLARVTELRGVPDFNLESEFALAQEFHMELVPRGKAAKQPPVPKRLTRGQVEQLCERKESGAHVAADHDHDE
ncbi:MAG: hypothetical protein ABI972_29520 [Acidobacteriota bacterium]